MARHVRRWLCATFLMALTSVVFAQSGRPPPDRMPTVPGPLASWVGTRPHLGPDSIESFSTPPQRLNAFDGFVRALASQDWTSARRLASGLNYVVAAIDEGGSWFVVAYDPTGRDATIVLNLSPDRDVIFQAPHVPFEAGTAQQAVLLLRSVRGRAALIAGAHRCASRRFAGCSGTTDVCGRREPYRDSDVGHYTETLFHTAHRALAMRWLRSVSVSLHGMREDSDGTKTSLIVSSGAHGADSQGVLPATRLRAYLGQLPLSPGTVVSCNLPSDEVFGYRKLCGFTNVQGRLVNGSADICSTSTEAATGRFVHLEQDWSVLRPYAEDWQNIGRYPLSGNLPAAFSAVMPAIAKR
jgi:hypothetical protein